MKTYFPRRFRHWSLLAAACLLAEGHPLRAQSTIVLQAVLTGTNAAGALVSVAGRPAGISGDTLVIPTTGSDGSVCVFVRNGTAWTQQAFLQASNRETGVDDGFGAAAVSGDTIVVGAPFEDSNATGVNGNQHNNSAPDSGAAYVFERTGTIWTQVAYLKASVSRTSMEFGGSVAISGDTIVVGARLDSTRANAAGAAYVFVRGDAGWTQQAVLYASNAGAGDSFGEAVAISGDTIVAGAQYESSSAIGVNGNQNNDSAQFSGAAYVFVRNGATWTQQAYLKASNTEIYDYFGSAIAISGDTIVVGAANEDSNAPGVNGNQGNATSNGLFNSGAAYVFARSGTTWTQQAYLKSDSPDSNGQFGTAVATTGDFVTVGTYGFAGHELHLFVRQGTQWSSHARLDRNNSGAPMLVSWHVAASGDTIAAANSVFVGFGPCTNCPPSFTVQPANQLVSPGTNVTLLTAVRGATPICYQWRFEGIDISGATNATYSFTNASLVNGHGNFSVVVSNAFGSVTSTNAFIFVRIAPGIVTQPVTQTVLQGQNATFTCVATGAPPIFYRWVRSGILVFTNTTGVAVFSNVQSSLISGIRCTVANAAGSRGSASASLIVMPDFDGDGIADSWEMQYGLNTNNAADALLDFDGDRMSNRDEYLAATNPTDGESVLKLAVFKTNGITLQFTTQSNRAYAVQFRTNVQSAAWQTLSNMTASDTPRTAEIFDPVLNSATKFYRVVTPPEP